MGAGGTAEGQRREGECEEGKVSEATFAGFTPRVVMCACVRVLRRREREEGEEVPLSVVDFLEVIEHPLKDKHVPQEKGQYIYTSMLGTAK